ncbi:uncharacterized protein LOC129216490 [Uloborus diversus]|uniref:uncharacterized protein LOC129216490 n=1 Tax=Uloborus diversus TaxID=327109 RepID=UPI0024097866|nr:uncharacterized protein LOC129216490 [Uloborus diversus]
MDYISKGDRVNVLVRNVTGVVGYIGETHFADGVWYGVVLDDAKGKNDGTVDGVYYFGCPNHHGVFVRRHQLKKEVHLDMHNASIIPRSAQHVTRSRSQAVMPITENNFHSCIQFMNINNNMLDFKAVLIMKDRKLFEVVENNNVLAEQLEAMHQAANTYCKDHYRMLEIASSFDTELKNKEVELNYLKGYNRKINLALQKSEKRRIFLEKNLQKFMHLAEHVIIEKEIAEANNEQLLFQLRECEERCENLALELDVKKEEMEIQKIDELPAKHYIKELKEKNRVLNAALLKLREYYFDQREQTKEAKQLLENNLKITESLELTRINLLHEIEMREDEINDLFQSIDDLMTADEVVFDVIDRNTRYEQDIINLYRKIDEIEEELEISTELEQVMQEIIFQDREELQELITKLHLTITSLEQGRYILKERDYIIEQYKDLTSQFRKENFDLCLTLQKTILDKKNAVRKAEKLKLYFNQIHSIRMSSMGSFEIGDRVRVLGKDATGKVAYVGKIHTARGLWIGVSLDEPKGRINGTVDGRRYFKCERNHGVFVRSCELEEDCPENNKKTNKSSKNYPNYLRNTAKKRQDDDIFRTKCNKDHDVKQTVTKQEIPSIRSQNVKARASNKCRELKKHDSEDVEEKLQLTQGLLQEMSKKYCKALEEVTELKKELETEMKKNQVLTNHIALLKIKAQSSDEVENKNVTKPSEHVYQASYTEVMLIILDKKKLIEDANYITKHNQRIFIAATCTV